jgi:hypothetical protein
MTAPNLAFLSPAFISLAIDEALFGSRVELLVYHIEYFDIYINYYSLRLQKNNF